MPKSIKVLFTSAGRRVELLQSFQRAFSELKIDGEIIATDINPLAPSLYFSDKVYIVPPSADPEYPYIIRNIALKEQVDLIFPLTDLDIPILSRIKQDMVQYGVKVVVVDEAAAKVTSDKLLTYKHFRDLNIPTPKSWTPSEILGRENINFPLFIKPRFGSAGKQTFRVDNQEQLEFFIHYINEPIIQEFLPGPEVTTDVICDFNGNVLGIVSRQRLEVRGGEVSKGKTIYDPLIAKYAKLIARSLSAVGPITIQSIYKDGTPFFTEINARFGGGAPLGFAAGVDAPKWLLALAAGLSLDIPPVGEYKRDLFMVRYDKSLFLTKEDINNEIKSSNF